jgi:hypothetical protein
VALVLPVHYVPLVCHPVRLFLTQPLDRDHRRCQTHLPMAVENGPADLIPRVKEEREVILVANYLRMTTHPLGGSREEAMMTTPVLARPNSPLGESPTLICCWSNQVSPATTVKRAKMALSFLRSTGRPRAKFLGIALKCGTLSMAF